MAENDDAVLTAAVGYVYTAAPGTAHPTPAQLKSINLGLPSSWAAAGWTSVGHTSRGTLPEFGFDGDKSEIKGSWQKKKLREVDTDDPIDSVTVVLHQFDENSLSLYYGENASSTAGEFGVATGSSKTEKAVYVVIEDGDLRLGFYAFKSSVKRDDSIELPIDDLAALPIRFTFLDYEDEKVLFKWINEDLFGAGPVVQVLNLHGATGGNFTVKVNGVASGSINVSGLNASGLKTAIVAVDDGISASQVTVTLSGSNYEIAIPANLSLGTDSTTGGTGVTIS